MLDVIVEGYEVSPPVLVPLLLTAAGLLVGRPAAGSVPRNHRRAASRPSTRSIPLLLPNVGRPLTTDELLDVRAELVPARPPVALVAEASIDLHPRMIGVLCPQDRGLCMIGALVTTDGTMPVVYADRTVRELYQTVPGFGSTASWRSNSVATRCGSWVAWSFPQMARSCSRSARKTMAWADEINAGQVVAVDGWLGVLGWGVECPAPLPELVGDGDPDDSPFVRCPAC